MILDILSWICLIAGGWFVMVGGIGLLRLPDFYTRIHAGGLTDTLGATLILLGCAFQAGEAMETTKGAVLVIIKLVLIMMFLFFTSPTSGHALANAAWLRGVKPHGIDDDELTPQDETGGDHDNG